MKRPPDTTWWRKAVIYEITPHLFTRNSTYADIEKRLPELAALGINTVWLQPLFLSCRGHQGYDVIDYYTLRPEFGSEHELRSLIDAAHHLGLHVLFDFVANHTSVEHPYAKERSEKGGRSRYYNFYQSQNDHAAYSSFYRINKQQFVTYFWDDLVNLNVNEPAVQRWIIGACTYWIKRMNIDGYRFDAAWGFSARSPAFARRLTRELRELKPALLLIAEDKGSELSPYALGFTAAYDWAPDTTWVSHWSWEYDYTENNSKTVFNHPLIARRKFLLEQALFGGQQRFPRLRFLENNDTRRFITNHSLAQTKMAAALLFSLPGIPLIYNGQEIGCRKSPYKPGVIFPRDTMIAAMNPGLFAFYQRLTSIRKNHPVLSGSSLKKIDASGDGVICFYRGDESEKFIVCINLDDGPVLTTVNLSGISRHRLMNRLLTDLVTNEVWSTPVTDNRITLAMAPASTRIIWLK